MLRLIDDEEEYKTKNIDDKWKCIKGNKIVSNEELLRYLRQFYDENGRIPRQIDFPRSSKYPGFKIYITIFGSWNKAIELAGFKPRNAGGQQIYTRDKLLGYLRQFYEDNKRSPMAQDFVGNPKYPHFSTFIERLGNWNKVLKLAGLTVNKFTDLTTEELLDYLKKFYQENGWSPTTIDFTDNDNYPSFRTYFLVFGSLQNALKLADLPLNYFTELSEEELLGCLIKFYEENDRPPTQEDFMNNSKYPHCGTYRRTFGSWSKALKLVELDVDSIIKKGIIETNSQKARLSEVLVLEYLGEDAVDLSGENCNSTIDGICPKGQPYDVKSSHLYIGKYWIFILDKREGVDFYYLLAFNEDWTKLLHIWRIPNFIKGNYIRIGIIDYHRDGYNIENMKEYEISDKFKKIEKFEGYFD